VTLLCLILLARRFSKRCFPLINCLFVEGWFVFFHVQKYLHTALCAYIAWSCRSRLRFLVNVHIQTPTALSQGLITSADCRNDARGIARCCCIPGSQLLDQYATPRQRLLPSAFLGVWGSVCCLLHLAQGRARCSPQTLLLLHSNGYPRRRQSNFWTFSN
jgi:hypothetical protein